jgi:hypothetical protein
MRVPILAVAIVLGLFLTVGSTTAAEQKSTSVSENVLADLGLAGMEAVSDDEGMQIRGKGFKGHGHHGHHGHGHHGHHGHHHHGHKHKHKHHHHHHHHHK